MLNSTLAVILVLGLLIFFHELGHFLIARLFKIGVSIFSLGFGPKLLSFQKGKTQYRLSAIPLGGYVKLVGESKDQAIEPPFAAEESFALRPAYQKMLVVVAGPLFNLLLAWFIFWGLFFAQGKVYLLPQIGEVVPNTPAQAAGLQAGDLILEVNGQKIETWSELVEAVQESDTAQLTLKVQRNQQILTLHAKTKAKTLKNIFGETVVKPQLGIIAADNFFTQKLSFFAAAQEGLVHTGRIIKLTWLGIVKLIERILPLETIGGPLTIAKLVSDQAKQGWVNLLNLTALLSINLGLLNLLPIPILDGGHILFYSLEMIMRRPLSERIQQISLKIGLALLLLLMGIAIYNDLMRIFK